MTFDKIFEMVKEEYDKNTVDGYNKYYLRNLYLTKIRYNLSLKMSNLKNYDFFNFLWDGDDYKNSLHDGYYVFKTSAWLDDNKVSYIKSAIDKYYSISEKETLLKELNEIELPINNVDVINNAPDKLNQEIIQATGDDKEFLNEIKRVVYQTLDDKNKEYFLNLAKAYGSEQNQKVSDNILHHENDSSLTKAFVDNFFKDGEYQYETIDSLPGSYEERKLLFDSFLNPKKSSNLKKDKLKQAAKIIYEKLYDGKPIIGEEGNKVYSARKFYESFIRINDLINEPILNMDALRKEYDNYKRLKEEYIDVIKQVDVILSDTDAYAGNMDLSRTENMPNEFIINYKTVSAMNAIWIMIGRTKDFNMNLSDMIDNPYQVATKIIKTELEVDYNKIFDKNDFIKSLDEILNYVPTVPKDSLAIARFVTNCFMADDNDVNAKIFERLFNAIYFDVMHSADFVDNEPLTTMSMLALFTNASDDIDLNFFLSKNYFNLDNLKKIPNYYEIREDKIFNFESMHHISVEDLYQRFNLVKAFYDKNKIDMTMLNDSVSRYIKKYISSFKASDFVLASKIICEINSTNFSEKLPITSSIKTLSGICDEKGFPALLKYALENAFDEYPIGKVHVEKYINACYEKLGKTDNIKQLYNQFLMKSNCEILFTAFQNERLVNEQKNLLNYQQREIKNKESSFALRCYLRYNLSIF